MNCQTLKPDVPTDIVRLLRQRATRQSKQLAFSFLDDRTLNGRDVSYEDLDRQARVVASALLEQGLSGERAVLLFQPGVHYVIAILGCWYAGLTAVPVYAPRMNASCERVRLIVQDCRAAVILSTATILADLEDAKWGAFRCKGLRWLATDVLPEGIENDWAMPDISPQTLAVLQYTSGSTGQPKGVRLQHRHLLINSRMISSCMQSNEHSVGVVWIPPFHDMGLIGGILQPLYQGFPVYLMSSTAFLQRPVRWLQAMTRYRGTISAAPDFAYELCARRVNPEQIAELDLSNWRVAANGAEPIHAKTMQRFAETFASAGFDPRAFLPCYGMAETTLLVAAKPHASQLRIVHADRAVLAVGKLEEAEHGSVTLVSSGRPDPEVRIEIVDPVARSRCAEGTIGEVWVTGDTVADGYWSQPEATAEYFRGHLQDDEADWLRTGDLGALLDGELFITGRIKDLILIRGRNHYPQDIEATALAAHRAVRARGAAAFSLDTPDGESLGLVVELDRGWQPTDLTEAAFAIRDAVSREHELQLAELLIVRSNTIPRTSSGKVQRLLTKERFLAGRIEPLQAGVCS